MTSPSQTESDVEAVARAIDPDKWENIDRWLAHDTTAPHGKDVRARHLISIQRGLDALKSCGWTAPTQSPASADGLDWNVTPDEWLQIAQHLRGDHKTNFELALLRLLELRRLRSSSGAPVSVVEGIQAERNRLADILWARGLEHKDLKERSGWLFASTVVRRGRELSDAEKMENLRKAIFDPDAYEADCEAEQKRMLAAAPAPAKPMTGEDRNAAIEECAVWLEGEAAKFETNAARYKRQRSEYADSAYADARNYKRIAQELRALKNGECP